ncbi:MAG: HIT family protein, partial [Planctomycetia bacterium]|nr:HIT family protein [Planctomycetia bacterium]
DQRVFAFMDINPIAKGHMLLIPRQHYELVTEMSADLVGHIFSKVPALAAALVAVTGADGVNVLQNNGQCSGQVVPHMHIHLIPRWPSDGLGFRWPAQDADPEELKRLADAVAARL